MKALDSTCTDAWGEGRAGVWQRVAVLAILVVLMLARQPLLLVRPRFWAEEGASYFSYAFSHEWWNTFFLVIPSIGYYSLIHNLGAVLATFVPLEFAPLVTTYIGFLFALLSCTCVLFGNSPFWGGLPRRAVIAFAIVLLFYHRAWLTTTYIHYSLALIVFLLLLENWGSISLPRKVYYRTLFLISSLSGPIATFLTPVYFLKAYRTRLRSDWVNAVMLGVLGLFHAAIFWLSSLKVAPEAQGRFVQFTLDKFMNVILFQFSVPFFGYSVFESDIRRSLDIWFKKAMLPVFGVDSLYWPPFAEMVAGLLAISYVIYLMTVNSRDREIQLVILSFLLTFLLSTAASLNMSGGQRYSYVPSIMLVVLMSAEWRASSAHLVRKTLAILVLGIMLTVHLAEFRLGMDYVGPDWREEVRLWRQDGGYALRIWPYSDTERWVVKLDENRR